MDIDGLLKLEVWTLNHTRLCIDIQMCIFGIVNTEFYNIETKEYYQLTKEDMLKLKQYTMDRFDLVIKQEFDEL